MENNTALQTAGAVEIQPTSFFGTKDLFEHVQRVATMFSKSELVPKRYQGNIGNCIIALEMAQRIGASPLMVMQNLDVILGKPSWSSKFLIASLNASGKFSPLRYEEDDQSGGRTRAVAYDKMTGEKVFGAWVSMEMAKLEGWIEKNGSKWKTMPELMRRYRAASFFTNQFAPEVSMGLQTIEEAYDIGTVPHTPHNPVDQAEAAALKLKERVALMIQDATSLEHLEALESQVDLDADQKKLFDEKWQSLLNPVANAGK
jgi:hypothetical protein